MSVWWLSTLADNFVLSIHLSVQAYPIELSFACPCDWHRQVMAALSSPQCSELAYGGNADCPMARDARALMWKIDLGMQPIDHAIAVLL